MMPKFFNFFSNKKRLDKNNLHGELGIKTLGHRNYVGGMWDKIGRLQFEFLLKNGLQSNHRLLDIGCGSLRAGIFFIDFLDKGHYTGIDKEQELITLGIKNELGHKINEDKKPNFIVSESFDFNSIHFKQDFAIAQSVFTHLPIESINLCMSNLRPFLAKEGCFFATFFESHDVVENPKIGHDHLQFSYTKLTIFEFGMKNGWFVEYIGEWNHPRGQVMVKYIAK